MRKPVLLAIALRTSSLRLSGPVLAGRRRLVASMPGAIATVAATAQPALAGDARTLARQGMSAFEKGDVEESIQLFDAAEEADPRYATRLWQRGLSYYYADRFKDARKQFLMDVAENPNDTEEAVWHLLAMARTEGLGKARPQMIKMGRDPRRVMRTVEEAFRNGDAESIGALEAIATDGGAGDRFYASLYRGLLAEAAGQPKVSADWISRAVENKEYAASGDYMYALAKVHQSRRKK
jgi:tetratricopeptide (TPR) repeat protein